MVKKNLHLIPLLILAMTMVHAIYIVSTTSIIFSEKHYLGISCIAICIIGYIIRRNLGAYLTGLTLLLGTFNLIAFTPAIVTYSFGFGINDVSVTSFKIQSFSLVIFFLFLILNLNFLRKSARRNK